MGLAWHHAPLSAQSSPYYQGSGHQCTHLLHSARHQHRPRHVRAKERHDATTPHPAPAKDGQAAGLADEIKRPDGALTVALGPIPAIYVPRSPRAASITALLWHATVSAARRVERWATRHQRHTVR